MCTLWDPIECTLSMYLNSVLLWPDDGCLQPKHVALKFYKLFVIFFTNIVLSLDGNEISILNTVFKLSARRADCCNLTDSGHTLHKGCAKLSTVNTRCACHSYCLHIVMARQDFNFYIKSEHV